MAKWVYKFEEGNASMRNLLGGKGCNLAEMTGLGMPIPQGFTVTTEACTEYYNCGKTISKEIEDQIFEASICSFRCSCFYARYDGYYLKLRFK